MTQSIYLGAIALVTLCLSAWFAMLVDSPGASLSLERLGLGLLALWPCSEAVIAVVNHVFSGFVAPRRLSRMALRDGIPEAHQVLVVMPAMLSNAATLQALVGQLERHYLANQEAHAQFALLSDFTDADQANQAEDGPLLTQASALVDALEARHARHGIAAGRRFVLLHRPRRWSPTEQHWIGWERKRGKLTELIAWLAGQAPSPFLDLGAISNVHAPTTYVLTLDSDTILPPGALRELVGVAAHPFNRPRVDRALRRVVSGYGILQPRTLTPMSRPAERTLYHWLFAGQGGTDPYSAVSSEVYQDVFGEGSYIGKGLLHVQAVHAVLGEQLPDGLILSHDLIEGCLARCGGVSDVALIEDDLRQANVAASRLHRWTRGDWQLLPILLQPWRFHLRLLHRWKVLDNLRRSLVEPMSLALIAYCLLISTNAALAALALAAAAFGTGPLVSTLAGLAPHRGAQAVHFLGEALLDLGRAIAGVAWHLCLLLSQAELLVDAMARSVYRMAWSHRHLLQWTTTAATTTHRSGKDASGTHGGIDVLQGQGSTVLMALLLAISLLFAATPSPVLALVLCALWSAAPVCRWAAGRPWRALGPKPLDHADH